MEEKPDGFSRIGSAISGFFAVIARFFAEFATAMAKGDLFVKLTLVWWGAGYLRRKQYVKALLMTLLEAAVILFTVNFAMNYVPKFGTLGTVQAEQVFNMKTMQSEWNNYDNSFMILLFSLCSFVIWFATAIVCIRNVVNVYALQKEAQLDGLRVCQDDLQRGHFCQLHSGGRPVQDAGKEPDQHLLHPVLLRRRACLHSHFHPVHDHAEVLCGGRHQRRSQRITLFPLFSS